MSHYQVRAGKKARLFTPIIPLLIFFASPVLFHPVCVPFVSVRPQDKTVSNLIVIESQSSRIQTRAAFYVHRKKIYEHNTRKGFNYTKVESTKLYTHTLCPNQLTMYTNQTIKIVRTLDVDKVEHDLREVDDSPQ
jgi:hypothetical protein